MLEILLDKYVIYVLMGGAAVCGIISKLVVSITLKRLVKASGNMNKSTHPLMRLVRAKFEHACMISERVENVRVFVDKYLYEFRAAGIKLHSLRRMERVSAGVCLVLGFFGAGLAYSRNGMQDAVLQIGAAGAGLAILVFLIHLTTDENYRMDVIRNYMVDYLENICLHRYEKAYQKELKVMAPEVPVPDFGKVTDEPIRPRPGREVPSPETPPEIMPPVMPEPYDVPDTVSPVRGMSELTREVPAYGTIESVRETQARDVMKPGKEALARDGMKSAGEVSMRGAAAPAREAVVRSAAELGKDTSVNDAKEQDASDILAAAVEATKQERKEKKEKSQDIAKDILIRQILEEFMA